MTSGSSMAGIGGPDGAAGAIPAWVVRPIVIRDAVAIVVVMVFGLTALGLVHTILGLVALAAGVGSLASRGAIDPARTAGRVYIAATFVTAATALALFHHGGAGPAHALAALALVALAVAFVARRRAWPRVEVVALSATLLFHVIPGVTETLTRLPADHPIFQSAEDPALKPIHGALLVAFLILVTWQVRTRRWQR
jgi:hypothetical protein